MICWHSNEAEKKQIVNKDHFDFRAVGNFLKHFKIISCKYNVEEECGNLKTINWQDSIRRRGSFDLYRLHEAKEKGLEFFIKKTSKLLIFVIRECLEFFRA